MTNDDDGQRLFDLGNVEIADILAGELHSAIQFYGSDGRHANATVTEQIADALTGALNRLR